VVRQIAFVHRHRDGIPSARVVIGRILLSLSRDGADPTTRHSGAAGIARCGHR
jgi:hypothetical protein